MSGGIRRRDGWGWGKRGNADCGQCFVGGVESVKRVAWLPFGYAQGKPHSNVGAVRPPRRTDPTKARDREEGPPEHGRYSGVSLSNYFVSRLEKRCAVPDDGRE